MMTITEKTNAELACSLDYVEEGEPVTVLALPLYGENKEGEENRIYLYTYDAPEKGTEAPVYAATDDLEAGFYKMQVWSNLDEEKQQKEIRILFQIEDSGAF